MKKGKLLIVDDNEGILKSLEFSLKSEFGSIETLRNPNLLPSMIGKNKYDVVILDMNFTAGIITGNEGIFWLREILKYDPTMAVIMITAYGDIDLAVRAMKEGAVDFVVKPWDRKKLISAVQTAIKIRETKNKSRKNTTVTHEQNDLGKSMPCQLIGDSQAMKQLMEKVEKVAATDANVLLLGENGTGKELIAREIHMRSPRASRSFVMVDMAALPASLFESELFGHVQGAFTDAKDNRVGRFESAHLGSLFLDEIGNLPVSMQAKILVALQSRQIHPVGSSRAVPIDIRLISATNKPLHKMIQTGEFREDLLFRINTVELNIPPLRERGQDIQLLADFFLREFSEKYGKNGVQLSEESKNLLMKYHWPGNVRELRHTVEKAVIMNDTGIIQPVEFVFRLAEDEDELFGTLNLEMIEKNAIQKALRRFEGNVSQAAKELGITRKTLYAKMERYGL